MEAVEALDQALQALDPRRLPWIKTHFWQRVEVPGLNFESEGLFLAGPNRRLRLDLKVHVGGTDGLLQVVSDGATLWQSEKIGAGTGTVSKVELNQLLDGLTPPSRAAQLREEFYQAQGFAGVEPLLRSLRSQVRFTRRDAIRWRGRPILKLTGVRSRSEPLQGPWPALVARQCRLFLDAESLWPHRLEWWGPVPSAPGDVLLMQMEFRNPVLHQAQPENEFTFDPGSRKVDNRTAQWAAVLRNRALGLADSDTGGLRLPSARK